MASNSNADVLMLFGVEGGGDVRVGSGKDMYADIKKIVEDIQNDITKQLRFEASTDSLKALREQVETALSEAVNSIKGTPVELTFSFDQKSIDAAFAKVKKEIKEQQITVSAMLKEKKESKETTTPSIGNISKETSEAKQEIKEVERAAENTVQTTKKTVQEVVTGIDAVLNKAVKKISNSSDPDGFKSFYIKDINEFSEAKKRAFSTEEIALFDKALDLAFSGDRIDSVVNYFNSIKDQAKDTKEIIKDLYESLTYSLSQTESKISTSDLSRQSILNSYENDFDIIQHFVKSRRSKASKENGFIIDNAELGEYWLKNDSKYGSGKLTEIIATATKGIDDEAAKAEARTKAINKAVEELIINVSSWNMGFKYVEDTQQLIIKDYEKIDEIAEGITEHIQRETNEAKNFNSELDKAAKHLGIVQDEMGEYTFTLDQMKRLKEDLPDTFKTIYDRGILSMNQGLNGQDVLDYEYSFDDIKNGLQEAAANAKPILDTIEKEFDDVTESGKEAAKAFDIKDYEYFPKSAESFKQGGEIIIRTYQDMQRALEEYKKSFHIEDNPYFPSSVDSFRPSSTVNPITSLPQLQETTKALSQNVTPVLMLPEVSTATKQMQEASQVVDVLRNKMQGLSEVSVYNITEGTINSVDNLIDEIKEETKVLQDNTDTTNENAEAQAKLAKEQQKAADAKAKADAKKAQKAADQEEKALRKVEEVIARTDTRLTALNNNLNNLQSSRYNANELTGSFEAQILEIDQLIKGIKTYISLSTDERQSFDWAEYGAENVTTLSEALGELNSKLVITEASMKKTKIDTGFLTNEFITTAINQFNQALRAFKNTQGAESYKDLFNLELIDPEDITKSRAAIQTIIKDTERLTTTTRSLNEENRRAENIIIQRNKIYQEADNYYKKYQSGIKANITLNKQWLDLIEKIKAGGFGDNNEAARKAFAELQTATKAANAEVMTLWGSLKKLFTDHFGSVSATAFIGTLRNIVREAYQNVLAIDKAMTELRKVTNETEKQYERFMNTAADLAIKVGGTIADTISSTADFARLGFNLDQSTALAEAAMVYKNVGDGLDDINAASESIISTIKAFSDIDAKDAMSIIDRFNEVGEISVELPTPRLIQNRWQIAISVNGWRQLRPREGYYIYCY